MEKVACWWIFFGLNMTDAIRMLTLVPDRVSIESNIAPDNNFICMKQAIFFCAKIPCVYFKARGLQRNIGWNKYKDMYQLSKEI